MAILRIEGTMRRPYAAALFDATSSLVDLGGWVSNQQIYSNLMATISFEIPADKLEAFVAALSAQQVTLHETPATIPAKPGDLRCQLVLNFLHDDPDVKHVVPAFG